MITGADGCKLIKWKDKNSGIIVETEGDKPKITAFITDCDYIDPPIKNIYQTCDWIHYTGNPTHTPNWTKERKELKCPVCEAEGLKHGRLYHKGGSKTLMGGDFYFIDKNGLKHKHDVNKITSGYTCSYGHSFITKGKEECPSCAFGGIEEIIRN